MPFIVRVISAVFLEERSADEYENLPKISTLQVRDRKENALFIRSEASYCAFF